MEWLPKGQTVRCNRWRKFDRFSDGTQEAIRKRNHFWEREVADFGRLRQTRDNAQLNLVCDDRNPGLNYKDVGLYGCRIGLNMA